MLPTTFLNQVNEHFEGFCALSDENLKGMALDLGFEAQRDGKIPPLLVRGFAMVKAASKRHLGMEHYPVQLTGGRAA